MKLAAFVSRRAMDETLQQLASPENGGIVQGTDDITQLQTQLKYLEDQVAFGQLRGNHPFFEWLDVAWRSAFSQSSRNEPDTRYITYQKQGTGTAPLTFTPDSLGGLRLFNETEEWLSDSGVDVTIPFDTKLPGTKFWSGLPGEVQGRLELQLPEPDVLAASFPLPGEHPDSEPGAAARAAVRARTDRPRRRHRRRGHAADGLLRWHRRGARLLRHARAADRP